MYCGRRAASVGYIVAWVGWSGWVWRCGSPGVRGRTSEEVSQYCGWGVDVASSADAAGAAPANAAGDAAVAVAPASAMARSNICIGGGWVSAFPLCDLRTSNLINCAGFRRAPTCATH